VDVPRHLQRANRLIDRWCGMRFPTHKMRGIRELIREVGLRCIRDRIARLPSNILLLAKLLAALPLPEGPEGIQIFESGKCRQFLSCLLAEPSKVVCDT